MIGFKDKKHLSVCLFFQHLSALPRTCWVFDPYLTKQWAGHMTWSRCWCCPTFPFPLGFSSCFPIRNKGMSELEGYQPNLPILRMRKWSQRGGCLTPGHPSCQWPSDILSNPVFPHCVSLTRSFQHSVPTPIPSLSSSLAVFLSHIPCPSSALCMPPICV